VSRKFLPFFNPLLILSEDKGHTAEAEAIYTLLLAERQAKSEPAANETGLSEQI
jgi:hypothetical protein